MDSVAQEIAMEERYFLMAERKQPWSVRTRRPFRGVTDKVVSTLKEELELAERVVMESGLPWGIKPGQATSIQPGKTDSSNPGEGDEILRIAGRGFESH